MKIFSLDLETTGFNPDRHQVLDIALVLEDTSVARKYKIIELDYFSKKIC